MEEDPRELDLLTEYFRSLREEIHLRIAEHTRLVWIKVFSLGAAITYLLKMLGGDSPGSSVLHYFVWIVPLAAIVFDTLIAGNLRVINNLGHYIRDYLEAKAFQRYSRLRDFRFWEECVAQACKDYHCYTASDVFVIWLFTATSAAFSFLIRWPVAFNDPTHICLTAAAVMGVYIAYVSLRDSITMERIFVYPKIGNVTNIEWARPSWLAEQKRAARRIVRPVVRSVKRR